MGLVILTAQNVFNDGGFVSLGFVGIDVSAVQRPEVIQSDMNSDIKGRLARSQWGLTTHDTLHNGRHRSFVQCRNGGAIMLAAIRSALNLGQYPT